MISDLPSRWREKAESLARYAPSAAEAFREAAETLEAEMNTEAVAVLSLREASEFGGFSVDHLAREVREGRIPNAGRKGAPGIFRKDVPVKPGHSVRTHSSNASSSPGARARRAAMPLRIRG